MSSVHGIIITHQRPEGLQRVVDALHHQTLVPDTLVLVDNGGSPTIDLVAERHRQRGHEAVVLRPEENTGPAGGTALAMSWLLDAGIDDDDWVIRLDDDQQPPRDDIIESITTLGSSQRDEDAHVAAVGMVGARYDWDRGQSIRIADDELDGPVDVDWLATGCYSAFSAGAIRRYGTFDPELFFGSSEVEYGLRLRRHGCRLIAHGPLWADVGRATADTAGPKRRVGDWNWRRYYTLRNQIHVLRANGRTDTAIRVALIRGVAKPLANLVISPRQALQHLRWNARAIRDGWRGQLGRTIDPAHFGVRSHDDEGGEGC